MKNILTTLFVIILSIVCFSFTTNKEEKDSKTPINAITKDQRFIDLVQNQYQEMNQVSDLSVLKNLDPNNLDSDDINTIASQLGYPSTSAYVNSLVVKTNTLKELDDEYNLSSYSTDQIIEFGVTVLTGVNGSGRSNNKSNRSIEVGGEASEIDPVAIDDPCNCKRKRRNCIATAAAAATAGHLACIALDPSVIAGIICHGAVIVGQSAATDDCHIDYEECVKNCRK